MSPYQPSVVGARSISRSAGHAVNSARTLPSTCGAAMLCSFRNVASAVRASASERNPRCHF